MAKVTIITDSSAYLPHSLIDQYGIRVVPLTLTWQGKTYRDGIDIQASEFYKMLAKSEDLPTTSQTGVHDYLEIFQEMSSQGSEALVLPISSCLSASIQSAIQAKTSFPGASIEIMETQLVSMALGFQVLTAARIAAEGATLAECKAAAEQAYSKIGVYFTVDTLTYLHKGGRIGNAKRLLGTALNIKPILQIHEGKIELVESVISSRKAIHRMIELVEKGIAGRTPVHISVFHAGVPEQAKELLAETAQHFNAIESVLSEVSPVVGSHTGPGTISIAYMAG